MRKREFLKRLSDNGKAIVLKGNHTNMFIEYLNGESLDPFNYIRNGEDETFAEFLHETKPFESWCLLNNIVEPTYGDFANWVKEARDQINNEFPELLQWLQDRPYYFETDNYIFTHASIDTLAKDWHNPHCFKYGYVDWDALMWDDGKFYGRPINNTDKTIVIGHFGTDHLRNIYGLKNNDEEDFSILRRDDGRIIAIDSTTAYTHKLNVLVIENEDLKQKILLNMQKLYSLLHLLKLQRIFAKQGDQKTRVLHITVTDGDALYCPPAAYASPALPGLHILKEKIHLG